MRQFIDTDASANARRPDSDATQRERYGSRVGGSFPAMALAAPAVMPSVARVAGKRFRQVRGPELRSSGPPHPPTLVRSLGSQSRPHRAAYGDALGTDSRFRCPRWRTKRTTPCSLVRSESTRFRAAAAQSHPHASSNRQPFRCGADCTTDILQRDRKNGSNPFWSAWRIDTPS